MGGPAFRLVAWKKAKRRAEARLVTYLLLRDPAAGQMGHKTHYSFNIHDVSKEHQKWLANSNVTVDFRIDVL